MDHPALNRILKQIASHKEELVAPENSVQEHYVREKENAEKLPPPEEDVANVFTNEVLEEREKELELAEQEEKRLVEKSEKDLEAMAEKIEDGRLAEIPPPETEEDAGKNLPEDIQDYLNSEKEEFEFHSCFDLRDFFEREKNNFEEWSHPAIDSVSQAVNSITTGCKCKIKERRKMVENYYVTFMTQNQHNNLIDKMKEILKTKKIKFYSEEKLFLEI